MPPSLGGRRSGTSTRRPAPRSSAGVQLEQQAVLEHAAGEHDGVEAARAGGLGARLGGRARDRAVEARARRPPASTPAATSSRHGGDRPARVEHAAGDVERIGAALGAVGDRLELDRRLALVGDLGAHAAQRGDGVEQPAHARRQRRGEPGAGQLGDRVPAARLDPGAAARASALPGRRRATRRPSATAGAPRGRRRACRTGHRCAGALEAVEVADQQLAAPDRAVGAVAGAVVDRPDRRAALAVLGQARGEVGVVVLDADVLDALARQRVGRRQVVGVQVVGDDLRRDREQPLEVRDALGEASAASRRCAGRRCGGRPTRARPWRRRTCS